MPNFSAYFSVYLWLLIQTLPIWLISCSSIRLIHMSIRPISFGVVPNSAGAGCSASR